MAHLVRPVSVRCPVCTKPISVSFVTKRIGPKERLLSIRPVVSHRCQAAATSAPAKVEVAA